MGSEIKQGPTGQRVAANLRRLRDRIPVRELATRLKEIGRAIAPSGITKIEQGTRRVDVDDLVALSIALGVSPNRLLLPETAFDTSEVDLTEHVTTDQLDAWTWATGRNPLHRDIRQYNHLLDPDGEYVGIKGLTREWVVATTQHGTDFWRHNHPFGNEGLIPTERLLALAETTLKPIIEAARELTANGVFPDEICACVQMFASPSHPDRLTELLARYHPPQILEEGGVSPRGDN
jgi:transcriptional regulator with XRE-family HTH domain